MLHGPATSTGGAALMVIVNGPIAGRLELNAGANLFGPGARANATIGRTLRLVLLNCLDCRPGVLDKSTQGWPGKYSLCFAEDEAQSPWEPLSVSRGVPPGRSAVTVYAAESGHNVLSHGTADPERLLACFADALAGLGSLSPGRSVVVFAPEHAQHLRRAGWTRPRVQRWLHEHAWRSLADLKRAGKVAGPVEPGDEARAVHRGEGPADVAIVVAGGGAGGHSAFIPSWSRDRNSLVVTRPIR
jgi:hypothetical protein